LGYGATETAEGAEPEGDSEPSDRRREILNDLDAGRLQPEEAIRLLESLG